MNKTLAKAFLARSLTTPLAVAVAKMLNADVSLTVGAVVLSGILGANFGKQVRPSRLPTPRSESSNVTVKPSSSFFDFSASVAANPPREESQWAPPHMASEQLPFQYGHYLLPPPNLRRCPQKSEKKSSLLLFHHLTRKPLLSALLPSTDNLLPPAPSSSSPPKTKLHLQVDEPEASSTAAVTFALTGALSTLIVSIHPLRKLLLQISAGTAKN